MSIFAPAFAAPAKVEGQRLSFLSVDIGDPEALRADERLCDYLREKTRLQFNRLPPAEYREAVYQLAKWKQADHRDAALVARVTPGVYLYAKMLGADLKVLGSYVSRATSETTYHSYFVFKKSEFAGTTLDELRAYLRRRGNIPPTFIYHDRFSTSSYLLPHLFFHKNEIFSVAAPGPATDDYTGIQSIYLRTGSSSILARIVNQTVTPDDLKRDDVRSAPAIPYFCAVWDSTYAKAAEPSYAGLNFVRSPQALPNDLLVISGYADNKLVDLVEGAVQAMPPKYIDVGDFLHWVTYDSTAAQPARRALGELGQALRTDRPPIIVDIAADAENPPDDAHLEAVRNAFRLFHPEFVVYDPDAHMAVDLKWVVRNNHDGSLIIKSIYGQVEETRDVYYLSFNRRDLRAITAGVAEIVNTRLPRLRYVWLHDETTPRVLRDLLFEPRPGEHLYAETVEWKNRAKNEFLLKPHFTATVTAVDNYSIVLSGDFPKAHSGTAFDFNPMGNLDYRVYLIPAREKKAAWVAASAFIVGLTIVGGVSPFWRLLRRRRP